MKSKQVSGLGRQWQEVVMQRPTGVLCEVNFTGCAGVGGGGAQNDQ